VGVLEPFRGVPSLQAVVPSVQARLTTFAALCFAAVLGLAAWGMLSTEFTP